VQRMLWKLFNIERTIANDSQAIEKMNGKLAGLRAELTKQEDNFSTAQHEQAKARKEVMKKEKAIKKQEKALEAKVCKLRRGFPRSSWYTSETRPACGGNSDCAWRA
jgi:chromosome segregation ATPase